NDRGALVCTPRAREKVVVLPQQFIYAPKGSDMTSDIDRSIATTTIHQGVGVAPTNSGSVILFTETQEKNDPNLGSAQPRSHDGTSSKITAENQQTTQSHVWKHSSSRSAQKSKSLDGTLKRYLRRNSTGNSN